MGGVGDFIQDEIIDPVKEAGRDIDDFVNDEIPGGWLTVGAATGVGLIGSGALTGAAAVGEGAALGSGISAGAGGATGLTAGAGGGTGLTAGGAVAGLDGVLGSGLSSTAAGEGLVAQTVPSAVGMGGGTGLVTEAAGGGLLSAGGVTAAGAVPMIGNAGSFINNPAVIGNPVVGYQAGPAYSLQDAFRAANLANSLFAKPPQQQVNPYQLMQQQQTGVVDYTPTLNLLAYRPTRQSLV